MSKVKNYYWNEDEKSSDVDNINLTGIDEYNVDDALFYAKEDYWKKANAAGRSS